MKKLFLLILFFTSIKLAIGQIDTIIKTPRNVSMSATAYRSDFYEAEGEIVAATLYWQKMIDDNSWNATIISPPTVTYNCHGYAWHVSDGGINVVITGSGNVEKYFSGETPTYDQTTEVDTLEKIVYYYDDHSAITSEDPSFVISKWGGGPLVKHHIADCPYDGSTVYYYKLNMTGDNSIPKSTTTNVTTLNIQGATYNWYGDSYVCASGGYVASVTGLETIANSNGTLRVELTSPYSNTTVKGNKHYTVGNSPTPLPTISGDRLVCSSGKSFTLYNLPAGNWVTWSSSSNLSTSDNTVNPCTFVATANGSAWVRATLHTPCSQVALTDYAVWAGNPILNVSGPDQGYVYNTYTFYANPGTYSNPSSYTWILNPTYGNNVYNYGSYSDIAFYNAGDGYQVVSRAQNTCGTGDWSLTNINISESGQKSSSTGFTVSPNPASDIITITINENTSLALTSSLGINNLNMNKIKTEGGTVYKVLLYNNQGALLSSVSKSGKSFTVPVNQLLDGIYILEVNDGKNSYRQQLIIKHN
jgi:hypothetical protein